MDVREFEVYIGYLDGNREQIDAGEAMVIEVRDTATFERKVVRALVSKSADELPGADMLWVMDWVERREPNPWAIQVIEELDVDTSIASTRSDIEEEDLTRMARESEIFSNNKYGGDGLAVSWGEEEAQKYLSNQRRVERDRQARR